MGNMFSERELKERREQVYDEFTNHLVSPIDVQLVRYQDRVPPDTPDVGIVVTHMGDSNPMKVRVKVDAMLGRTNLGQPDSNGYYCGDGIWNLNPRMMFGGHFTLPDRAVNAIASETNETIYVVIRLSLQDRFGREHELLPMTWFFNRDRHCWVAHPSPPG